MRELQTWVRRFWGSFEPILQLPQKYIILNGWKS
jgi:hypothetical protein